MSSNKYSPDLEIAFAFTDALSLDKKNLLEEGRYLPSQYNPFTINRLLSKFKDCVLLINKMNCNSHLPEEMQHDFLLYTIQPLRRRSPKRKERTREDDLPAIMAHFKYPENKARESLRVLSRKDISAIVKEHRRVKNAI